MKLKILVFLFAFMVLVVGLSPPASAQPLYNSGGTIFAPTPDTGVVSLSSDEGVICSVRGKAGSFAVHRDGVPYPVFQEGHLPPGHTLSKSRVPSPFVACVDEGGGMTGVFAVAFKGGVEDALVHLSGTKGSVTTPLTRGVKIPGTLLGRQTIFTVQSTYAYFWDLERSQVVQGGLKISGGKAVMAVVVTAPEITGTITIVVEVDQAGKITPLFVNPSALSSDWRQQKISLLSGMAKTDRYLYLSGWTPSIIDPNWVYGVWGLFRVLPGSSAPPERVKAWFKPTLTDFIRSVPGGIQLFHKIGDEFVFSFLPDSGPEQEIFRGKTAAGEVLEDTNKRVPCGATCVYVLSKSGAVLQFEAGKSPRLIKSAADQPVGIPVAIATNGTTTLYVQAEGSVNKTYRLFFPAITNLDEKDRIKVQAGRKAFLTGKDWAPYVPPTVSFESGINFPFVSGTGQEISIGGPDGLPAGEYKGQVNIVGTTPPKSLSFTLVVTPAPQPTPCVTAVVNAASHKLGGGFVPAMWAEAYLGCIPPIPAVTHTSFPTFELGGVSVTVNGMPSPVIYAGNNQVNFFVNPGSLRGTEADVVVTVNGMPSAPYRVPVATVSQDALFTNPGPDGEPMAVATDSFGSLLSDSNPARPGMAITAYGTGCRVAKTPPDNAPADQVYHSATLPTLSVGGVAVLADFAGLVPPFAGLCQYNLKIPREASSSGGRMSISFPPNGIVSTVPAAQ